MCTVRKEKPAHGFEVRERISDAKAWCEEAVRVRSEMLWDALDDVDIKLPTVKVMRERWKEEEVLDGDGEAWRGTLEGRQRLYGNCVVREVPVKGPEALLAASWTKMEPLGQCIEDTMEGQPFEMEMQMWQELRPAGASAEQWLSKEKMTPSKSIMDALEAVFGEHVARMGTRRASQNGEGSRSNDCA